MALPGVVYLNRREFTRKSVAVRPNGLKRLRGIDSIDWSDEVAKELVPGMNGDGPPMGQAHGLYTCSASLSIYLSHVDEFELGILALDPLAMGNMSKVVFQLPILAVEEFRTFSVVLADCTIAGSSASVGSDGSTLIKQYTIQPTYIVENGRSKVDLFPAL